MSSISAIIITKNEELNIWECLNSLKWVDEIVVVDAGSTDKTIDIAKEFTKKIFIRQWDGYGAAKNFALEKCTSDWIFWIDADERATPELQNEIQIFINSNNQDYCALSMPRRANFLGKWINHCGWYPGRIIRIFRRSKGYFTDNKVHERLEVKGKIFRLKSDLLHYTDPTLEHYLNKLNKYTSLAAEDLVESKKKFSIIKMLVNPVWTFIRMYFIKLGFLDGVPGLILSFQSSYYVFTKYAKMWEQTNKTIKV